MKPEDITAWALGELSAEERARIEAALATAAPPAQQTAREIQAFCQLLGDHLGGDMEAALTPAQRQTLQALEIAAPANVVPFTATPAVAVNATAPVIEPPAAARMNGKAFHAKVTAAQKVLAPRSSFLPGLAALAACFLFTVLVIDESRTLHTSSTTAAPGVSPPAAQPFQTTTPGAAPLLAPLLAETPPMNPTGSNAATLDLNGGSVLPVPAAPLPAAGQSSVTINGGSTLTMSGANTYTGATTVNAGVITLGGATTMNPAAAAAAATPTVTSGSLVKAGTGTLVLGTAGTALTVGSSSPPPVLTADASTFTPVATPTPPPVSNSSGTLSGAFSGGSPVPPSGSLAITVRSGKNATRVTPGRTFPYPAELAGRTAGDGTTDFSPRLTGGVASEGAVSLVPPPPGSAMPAHKLDAPGTSSLVLNSGITDSASALKDLPAPAGATVALTMDATRVQEMDRFTTHDTGRTSRLDELRKQRDEYLAAVKQNVASYTIADMTRADATTAVKQNVATDTPADMTRADATTAVKQNVATDTPADVTSRRPNRGTAQYAKIVENPFQTVLSQPLSTFSIDVDTASYANVRRFLNAGSLPPPDAVRLEEMINYFPYAYEPPNKDKEHEKEPFSVAVDLAPAPWAPEHRLARIAIKGREVGPERPAANFVFLIDVSGSMGPPERLPLIKQGLELLTEQLRDNDRVAIVTYAGECAVALKSTPGSAKSTILDVIRGLHAGGSTNGESGIRLAYDQATQHFIQGGINRVILCTDGDFNVGMSSRAQLLGLIQQEAKSGTFLSVLGVGTDNLQDHTMEILADHGNGNYAYLDSLGEARKVLVDQMQGTLITIAKDVKIQVEFNPAIVASYRLIGYEKRLLATQDFNNDKKDAGEIGAGHTVTALYEIIPVGLPMANGALALVDDLRYQPHPRPQPQPNTQPVPTLGARPPERKLEGINDETLTVKLRYKEPDGQLSKLIQVPVHDAHQTLAEAPRDFRFATAVAGFGLLLRDSDHAPDFTFDTVRQMALTAKGDDPQGYRGEFLQLIDKARGLKGGR